MALSSDAAAFVTGVSQQTGIDPRVLVAWVQVEGAYAPNGTGHYNFLNLRPYAGDPYSGVSSGNFEQFSNVGDAIKATVRRLNMPFAAPILQGARAHVTPAQQIQLIAGTGWDAGHYNGGKSLLSAFASIFTPAAVNSKYQGPDTASAVASTAGTGSAADAGSYDAGNAAKDVKTAVNTVTQPITAVADFLGKLTDPTFLLRAGEVIAGAVLIMAGVYLLARQIGLASAVPLPSTSLGGTTLAKPTTATISAADAAIGA